MKVAKGDKTEMGAPMPAPTWKPSPPEMGAEPIPLPDQSGEAGSEDADAPPARGGRTAKREKPTEGAGDENPIHHTGRVPPKVAKGEL